MTLAEAIALVERSVAEDGIKCPCCGQFVKEYVWKLNEKLAFALVLLLKLHKQEGVHLTRDIINKYPALCNRSATHLYRWGFIDAVGNFRSGLWCLNESGLRFMNGDVDAPKHVVVRDGKTLRFSDERTTFAEAVGDAFDPFEYLQRSATV